MQPLWTNIHYTQDYNIKPTAQALTGFLHAFDRLQWFKAPWDGTGIGDEEGKEWEQI